MADSNAQEASSLSKAQKAALVFLLLEEKGAASLFEHMGDEEIRVICSQLLKMQEIPVTEMETVLSEFYSDVQASKKSEVSGEAVLDSLMEKTIPGERGRVLLDDIKGGRGTRENPFEHLFDSVSVEVIYRLLKSEHPQTVAVVLSLVKPKLSKEILAQFDESRQTDLLYRMAMLSKVPEEMLILLAKTYRDKIKGGAAQADEKQGKTSVDVAGSTLVLKYLKTQDWAKAESKITEIEKQNPELGLVLRKNFFTLQDMTRADDNGMRNLLKNIETATLSVALKTAEPEVQNVFFSNMSTRAATILKEDIEVMPQQKPEDIDKAAQVILEEAKKLIQEGQMILKPVT